jgi:hypothetical protein
LKIQYPLNRIKYFACHNNMGVAAGFETVESRDEYIKLSISNGHLWRICTEEEARSCPCYHNRFLED